MTIHAVMAVRNEADRYLDWCLWWLSGVVDDIHVYDDQSTDDTAEIASRYATVTVRSDDTPPFLEHEGRFRQASWDAFEAKLDPQRGDWVLAIDADEFLVSGLKADQGDHLRDAVRWAEGQAKRNLRLHIPEVFAMDQADDGFWVAPHVRIDGLWGQIIGQRLFAYEAGGRFRDRRMGSGSEPLYVAGDPVGPVAPDLYLMHYGYAHPDDRAEKWRRYSSTDHGHSDAHIQSILASPRLVPSNPHIHVWRGRRPADRVWSRREEPANL